MLKYNTIKNKDGPGFRPVANYTFEAGPSGEIKILKGSIGGVLLGGEKNLSQEGTAWLDYESTAKENAIISDNAYVSASTIGGIVQDSAYVKGSSFDGCVKKASTVTNSLICAATTIDDDSVVDSVKTEGSCKINIACSSSVFDTSINSSKAEVNIAYSEIKRSIIFPQTNTPINTFCMNLVDGCLFYEKEQYGFSIECDGDTLFGDTLFIQTYPITIDRSWRLDFYRHEEGIFSCAASSFAFKKAIEFVCETGLFPNGNFKMICKNGFKNIVSFFEDSKNETMNKLNSLITVSWSEQKRNIFDMLFFVALFKVFISSKKQDPDCYKYICRRTKVDMLNKKVSSFDAFCVIVKYMLTILSNKILSEEELDNIISSAASCDVLCLDITGGVLNADISY